MENRSKVNSGRQLSIISTRSKKLMKKGYSNVPVFEGSGEQKDWNQYFKNKHSRQMSGGTENSKHFSKSNGTHLNSEISYSVLSGSQQNDDKK